MRLPSLKILVYFGIFMTIANLLVSICYKNKPIKPTIYPKINDCYILKYPNKNPFRILKDDTIVIMDIKNDYRLNNGFISSDEIDYISNKAIKTDSCNCLH
jgi:hypothetical protein